MYGDEWNGELQDDPLKDFYLSGKANIENKDKRFSLQRRNIERP